MAAGKKKKNFEFRLLIFNIVGDCIGGVASFSSSWKSSSYRPRPVQRKYVQTSPWLILVGYMS